VLALAVVLEYGALKLGLSRHSKDDAPDIIWLNVNGNAGLFTV
jgi:hypothetical protein